MRNLYYLTLLTFILAPLQAAAKNNKDVIVIPWPANLPCDARDKLPEGTLSGFAERRGEPSFARRYAPSLRLPAPEEQVLKIAKDQHFTIYLDGDGVNALCTALPSGQPVNDKAIRKVYLLVDGKVRRFSDTQINYLVYADGNGMVTYIEPHYIYTGP